MSTTATALLLAPSHWLVRCTTYVVQHATSVVLLATFAALLAAMSMTLSLHVKSTPEERLSSEIHTRQRELAAAFPWYDEITLRISGDPATILPALAALEQALKQPGVPTKSVVAYADSSAWRAKALHFFPIETLQALEASLRNVAAASSGETSSIAERWPGYTAFMSQFVELRARFARTPHFSADQRSVLVYVQLPTNALGASSESSALHRVLEVVNQVQRLHASVRITAEGRLLETQQRFEQRWNGLIVAMLLGTFGIVLLGFLGFGSWQPTLLLTAALFIGQLGCGGCVVLGLGSVSLSQALGWLLVVPFHFLLCVRYLAEYLEQRRNGLTPLPAWTATAQMLGVESAWTHAWLLAMMGLICVTSKIIDLPFLAVGVCSSATGLFVQGVLLPALVIVAEERFFALPAEHAMLSLTWVQRLPNIAPTFTRILVATVLCCALPSIGQLQFAFTGPLNHVAAEPSAMAVCESAVVARELSKQFASLPGVNRVDELASLLVPEDDAKRRLIVRIGSHLKQLLADQHQQTTTTANYTSSRQQLQMLLSAVSPEPPRSSDLPSEWVRRFVNEEGKYLLKIEALPEYQHGARLGNLVAAIERIAPNVAGTLVESSYRARTWQTLWLRTAIVTMCGSAIWWLLIGRSLFDTFLAIFAGVLSVFGLIGWAAYATIPLVGEHWLALFCVWLFATMPYGSNHSTQSRWGGHTLANITALLFAMLLSCGLSFAADPVWQGLGQMLVMGLAGTAGIRWGLAWGASTAVWESTTQTLLIPNLVPSSPVPVRAVGEKIRPRAVAHVHVA